MYTQIVKEEANIEMGDFLFILSGLVVLVTGGLVGAFWKKLPPEVPWLYSMPWGEQQLIEKKYWLVMLGGMVTAVGVTRMIAVWAGGGDRIVKATVASGTLLVMGLLLASLIRVLLIFV